MSFDQVDYIVKTIIIGDTNVGKTTMLQKLTNTGYMTTHNVPTIGVDFFTVKTKVNGFDIKLHIWDTAGHERYQNIVKTYFKNNAICYVVYDVCNYTSFKSVPMWINIFKKNTSNTNAIIVILANKIDIISKRVVDYEEGKKIADSYNALYFEVSSKTSVGLDKLVMEPTTQLLKLYEQKVFTASDTNGFKIINDKIKKISLEDAKIKKCCTIQ